MNKLLPWLLIIAICCGQLVKISFGTTTGATILDFSMLFLCILGLYQIKLQLKAPPLPILLASTFVLVGLLSLTLTPLNLEISEYITSIFYPIRFFSFVLLSWIIYSGGLIQIKLDTAKIIILSALSLSVLGTLQLIFIPNLQPLSQFGWDPHYFRTVSTFLDPNFLGAFLTLALLILTQNKLFVLPIKQKIILFVLIYVAFITCFSRGAALCLVISFLSLSFIKRSEKLLLLITFLVFGFYFSFSWYTTNISAPRNIDRTQSAEHRLGAWQQGIDIFQKAPILGVGYNSYKFALVQYHLADNSYQNSRGATTNDSSLLFVASTTGIIGFTFYLLFLASILLVSFSNLKNGNDWGGVIFSSTIGLLAQSFFSNTLFYPFLLLWIFLSISQLQFTKNPFSLFQKK